MICVESDTFSRYKRLFGLLFKMDGSAVFFLLPDNSWISLSLPVDGESVNGNYSIKMTWQYEATRWYVSVDSTLSSKNQPFGIIVQY